MTLDGEEAHHALRVARVRIGESIELFDGAGTVATGVVSDVGRRCLDVEVLDVVAVPAPKHELILCVAYPNRERAMERLIDSCVPLGVTDILVFGADRSERRPEHSVKWERWALEACKQSYRNWFPRFAVSESIQEALESVRADVILRLAPEASEQKLPAKLKAAGACACIVGPEGGLSNTEVEMADRRGAVPMNLGSNILRTELACTAISALVSYVWRSDTAT